MCDYAACEWPWETQAEDTSGAVIRPRSAHQATDSQGAVCPVEMGWGIRFLKNIHIQKGDTFLNLHTVVSQMFSGLSVAQRILTSMPGLKTVLDTYFSM